MPEFALSWMLAGPRLLADSSPRWTGSTASRPLRRRIVLRIVSMAGFNFSSLPRRSLPARCAIGLGAVVAAAGLRALFTPVWGPTQVPFLFFFPAIVVAAWLGRLGAGVLATALGGFAAVYLFLEPHRSMVPAGAGEVVTVIAFGVAGLIMTAAVEAMHRANARAQAELAERHRAENALRVAEARERARVAELQAVIDAVPAVIWIAHDPFARVVTGNQLMYEQLGLPPGANASLADEHGRDATRLDIAAHGRVLPPDELPLERAARGELVRNLELEVRLPDGTSRWLLGNATPLRAADGALNGSVAAFVDITARKRAEQHLAQREEQLRLITDHAPVWIIQVGADQRYLFVNVPYAARFGLTPRDLVGRTLEDVLGPQLYAAIRPHVDLALAGQRVEFETLTPDARRGDRHMRAVYVPQHDSEDGITGFVALVQDVTHRVEAARALRASEERFRQLADSMPQLVWTADGSGTVDYYNHRAAEYRGFERTGEGGWRWQPVLHPDDLDKTIAAWRHSLATGETYEVEHRVTMADGHYRWHLSRAVPVRGAAGQITRWFGTATDIHPQWQAQSELRESQRRLELAFAGARMGVWTWNLETNLTTWSPEMFTLFGADRFDGSPADVERLLHPEDAGPAFIKLQAAVAQHVDYVNEYRIIRPIDGELRWFADRGRADYGPGGQPRSITGVVMDITERKLAERQLEAARDEALAASRAKDDFLAMLSHELRTPLNPVLLAATEAAEDTSLPEPLRNTFELIASNVALEARLIDDLLDLNRIVLGKATLDRQPLDLHAVLREAVETVRPEIAAKQIQINFHLATATPMVSGDPVRLRQVCWNVLRNAVKFTPGGGSVAITTHLDAASRVELRITDSGIGMTADEVARVFQPFVQGDHASRKSGASYGGLGVGLAISRTLVERHDGTIHAESPGVGQGTTVVIALPLTLSAPHLFPPARPDSANVATPTLSPRRVLLVDDHAPTLKTLQALLERRGHRVTTAASLAEARQRANERDFDLLISDLGLPDGDGCSLIQELHRTFPDLPGIAVSGYGMDADFERSCAAGFRDHLTKPVSVAALERALLRLMTSPTAPPGAASS